MNDDLTDNDDIDDDTDDEQESYEKDLPKGTKATHSSEVRKRIDDLLEQKRLKLLLDDADDWDF